jgi:hypothetical protein
MKNLDKAYIACKKLPRNCRNARSFVVAVRVLSVRTYYKKS